jgi:hypothetical protein
VPAEDGFCVNCGMRVVDSAGTTYEIHGRVDDVLRVHDAVRRLSDASPAPAPGTVYNGPVFHISGDGAQLAWNNKSVVQNQTQQIAPGFEALAEAVTAVLRWLPEAGLEPEDQEDAEASANEVLTEVTKPEPDHRRIRRALVALKGFFAPLATGLIAGTSQGVQEFAKSAIQALGVPFGVGH